MKIKDHFCSQSQFLTLHFIIHSFKLVAFHLHSLPHRIIKRLARAAFKTQHHPSSSVEAERRENRESGFNQLLMIDK